MRVIGCTTRRPFSRHHRNRPAFRVGTRMPGPRNASAFAISAWTSALLSPTSVSEKTDHRGIRYDSAFPLGDNRCPLLDRVAQLAAAVVAMHTPAKPVAFLQIRHARGTYAVARSRALIGGPCIADIGSRVSNPSLV